MSCVYRVASLDFGFAGARGDDTRDDMEFFREFSCRLLKCIIVCTERLICSV